MANGTMEDLFRLYPCLNPELRMVANQAYKFGKQIAQEPSAALSAGLDEHAIRRQNEYLEYMVSMVDSLKSKPIPDWVRTHPTNWQADLTERYQTFVAGPSGEEIALNDQTLMLSELWLIFSAELLMSQSANMAGSLYEKDYERAQNNLGVLQKMVKEIASRPEFLDLAELGVAGAELKTTVTAVKK
jgi:hypothetical protein